MLRGSRASAGIGIVKVNRPASLPALVNFMLWKGESALTMQEFVEHSSTVKALCIGSRAAIGIRLFVRPGEFRTNRPAYGKTDGVEPQMLVHVLST